MAVVKLQAIADYSSLNVNREIYPDYKCNCTKFWKGEDQLIIYKATIRGVEKIFEDIYSPSVTETVETVVRLAGKEITDKVMIAGAHTVVNLKDRFHISEEVLKSAKIAFGLIVCLQERYGIKAEFLVPLNDFYMEKDAGTDVGRANTYRNEALNPYIIPPKLNELLVRCSKKLGRDLALHYCSEKNMADRFKRHIKSKKKDGGMFVKNGNNWEIHIGDERITVLNNDKPNCVAGNAATLRAIRNNIENSKIKDNFTSHIGIYPLCSIGNVLDGYKAANAFYGLDLPTFFVFCGKSCFDSASLPINRPGAGAQNQSDALPHLSRA